MESVESKSALEQIAELKRRQEAARADLNTLKLQRRDATQHVEKVKAKIAKLEKERGQLLVDKKDVQANTQAIADARARQHDYELQVAELTERVVAVAEQIAQLEHEQLKLKVEEVGGRYKQAQAKVAAADAALKQAQQEQNVITGEWVGIRQGDAANDFWLRAKVGFVKLLCDAPPIEPEKDDDE